MLWNEGQSRAGDCFNSLLPTSGDWISTSEPPSSESYN